MARTGFAFRQECKQHLTGHGHPERPERLEAIASAFEAAELKPTAVEVEPASRQDLLRVHAREHVDTIERVCATEGIYPDPDIVVSNGSWDAALLAAGGAIAACRAVADKQFDNAFCAMRPPGHHAEHNHAMGFCLFNNVAVAARWLQVEAGVKKIAILDWDVHHGNGTQNSFYDDDSVYYASMHQHPHYPGTGFPDERGKNNTNLNIQMPAAIDPVTWLDALERIILPEFERFDPDWLLISSGFDAHRLDPLGGQLLESTHFTEMTRLVRPVAGGRIVSLLEGGYHLGALGESSVAHFRALSA